MPTPAEIQDAKRLQQMGKAYDRAVYDSMGTTPPKPAKAAPPPAAPSAESRALAAVEDAKRQAQMDEAYNAAAARSMGTYKEPVKKASGGSVSSASSRADGCAQRGKTKGRMV
jgi:hypothetical protein